MLALDPKQTFPCVLNADRATERIRQPRFFLRALAGDEAREYRKFNDDDALKGQDYPTVRAGLLKQLAVVLVGWINVRDGNGLPLEYKPELLNHVLTQAGVGELYYAGLLYCRVDEADVKN